MPSYCLKGDGFAFIFLIGGGFAFTLPEKGGGLTMTRFVCVDFSVVFSHFLFESTSVPGLGGGSGGVKLI